MLMSDSKLVERRVILRIQASAFRFNILRWSKPPYDKYTSFISVAGLPLNTFRWCLGLCSISTALRSNHDNVFPRTV